MELGSWALISAPSILGLLPLIVFIVPALRGVENLSADYQRGFRCYFAGLGSWNAGTSV